MILEISWKMSASIGRCTCLSGWYRALSSRMAALHIKAFNQLTSDQTKCDQKVHRELFQPDDGPDVLQVARVVAV